MFIDKSGLACSLETASPDADRKTAVFLALETASTKMLLNFWAVFRPDTASTGV
jgi:hypothetical protein